MPQSQQATPPRFSRPRVLRLCMLELEKSLPNAVDVDCFRISFAPLKEQISKQIKAAR